MRQRRQAQHYTGNRHRQRRCVRACVRVHVCNGCARAMNLIVAAAWRPQNTHTHTRTFRSSEPSVFLWLLLLLVVGDSATRSRTYSAIIINELRAGGLVYCVDVRRGGRKFVPLVAVVPTSIGTYTCRMYPSADHFADRY